MDTNESQTEDADTSEVKRRKHKSMKRTYQLLENPQPLLDAVILTLVKAVKRKRKWAEATDDNEAPTPVLPTYLTEEEKARKQKCVYAISPEGLYLVPSQGGFKARTKAPQEVYSIP